MPDTEERLTVELTYAGIRRITGGKWGQAWYKPGDGKLLLMKDRTVAAVTVGSVYRFTMTSDSYYVAGDYAPRFIRQDDGVNLDRGLLNNWLAIDKANRVQRDANSKRRSKQRNLLEEKVKPIRQMYQSLTGSQDRTAFLAALIEEITRY